MPFAENYAPPGVQSKSVPMLSRHTLFIQKSSGEIAGTLSVTPYVEVETPDTPRISQVRTERSG